VRGLLCLAERFAVTAGIAAQALCCEWPADARAWQHMMADTFDNLNSFRGMLQCMGRPEFLADGNACVQRSCMVLMI